MTIEAQTTPETPPADPLGLADAEAPEPEAPRRRRRSLVLDAEGARTTVELVHAVVDERQAWNDQRLARYAKFRGWLDDRLWPFAHASNHHWPLLLEKVLRNEAGLFNALLSQRPVVEATATKKSAVGKTQQVTDLLDAQWWDEDMGEAKLDRATQQVVQDGTVVAKSYWVRDRREVPDVRRLDRDPSQTKLAQLFDQFEGMVEHLVEVEPLDAEGDRWDLHVQRPGEEPTRMRAEVYDVDEVTLEVVLTGLRTIDEGPSSQVLPIEAFLIPLRAENPHPVSPRNPKGARWVAHRDFVALADLERGRDQGRYRISAEDWAKIEQAAEGPVSTDARDHEDQMQAAKEAQAGLESQAPASQARDRWGVWVLEVYQARAVDGREQELVDWIVEDCAVAYDARYLSEVLPGLPLERPFAVSKFIPIPGQFYGMSLLELLEGLNDLTHALINQAIDAGTLANLPFGFYRPSSQMKPEVLRIEPGVYFPLDNPQTDVSHPQLQGRDQSFNLNMAGQAIQEADKLSAAGPLQQGIVPSGKASALRTTGTTLAILSEGAAQPQQILRRLFMGVKALFAHRHRLNVRYLPPQTAYKKAGMKPESEDAFGVIEDRGSLDLPLDFSFEASLLNANKGILAQSLQEIMAAVINPLALQLGLVGPEEIYALLRDYIRAHEQDATRYLKRPAGATDGPKLLAEEAMDFLLSGQAVPSDAVPYEPAQEHLQKLLAYIQDPRVQGMGPERVTLFTLWFQRVQQLAMQEQQQAMLMQAAGQFAQAMGNGGSGGPGGTPTTMASPPPQMQQGTQEEAANQPQGMGGA